MLIRTSVCSYSVPDMSQEEMRLAYNEIVAALTPHVDILLCETLSSLGEAQCAAHAAAQSGKYHILPDKEVQVSAGLPVWLSFTLEDSLEGKLRSGEDLVEATRAVLKDAKIDAILLNCCAPQTCTAALQRIRDITLSHSTPPSHT